MTYSRELKAQQVLEGRGIRTFVPMKRLREEKGGRVIDRYIPAINNLIFAYSDQQTLYEYILFLRHTMAHYLINRCADTHRERLRILITAIV